MCSNSSKMSRRKLMTVWLWVSLFVAIGIFVCWHRVHHYKTIISSPGSNHNSLKRQGSFGSAWRRQVANSWKTRSFGLTCEQVMKKRKISDHRYVMGLYYWEQLNMATGNLFSLVHVASDLGARTVLPFTKNSRLYGLPNFCADYTWSSSNNPSLDLLYDIPQLNQLACSFGLPPFASMQSFMQSARRDVVIVYFIHAKQARDQSLSVGSSTAELKAQLDGRTVAECSDVSLVQQLSSNISTMMNNVAMQHKAQPFQIAKYICVNTSHVIKFSDLVEKAGIQEDFTLVFVTWRGVSDNTVIKNSATGEHVSQRIHLSEISERPLLSPSLVKMPASSSVWGNGSLLLAATVGNKPFIGIHFRSEKIGQRNNRIPGFFTRCVEQALRVRNELVEKESKLNNTLKVLVFVDYGKQGSNSCRNCRGAKMLKSTLKKLGITPVHFEPESSGASSDSGFAAMVESSSLSRATHLVLVGGGAFQKQMALGLNNRTMHGTDQLQSRTKQSMYRICWEDLGRVRKLKML